MASAESNAVTAVILAAGKGTRMKSSRPKVLHEVCGRAMLGRVIDAAREAGADRVVVVVGHDRDRLRDAAASEGGARGEDDDALRFVVQEPQLGTGHALATAREAASSEGGGGRPRGTVLLLYGDVPLVRGETLRALLERHHRVGATMTLLSTRLDDPTGYGRVLRDSSDGTVTAVREQLDATEEQRAIDEINTGIYAFEAPAIFDLLERLEPHPVKGEVFLTDAVEAFRSEGALVETVVADDSEEFLGVNDRKGLAAAGAVLRRQILEAHMESGVTIVDPATTYIEDGVTIGRDTVVHPFTVIRSGVTIADSCEVGPFSHLRVGTRLASGSAIGNFTESKNAVLGERSKAKHLTYLGDAVLGSGVNVGAGTITANYDGRRKSRTDLGDDVFVGSGTIFVAPVEVGEGGMTGAGAVVPRGSKIGPGEVWLGVPARKREKRGSAS